MIWLAAHMWFLLFLAFGTGLGVGWWIWGAQTEKTKTPQGETVMGSLDDDPPGDAGDL